MQYDYWSRISRYMVLINDIWSGVFHSASDVCERAVWLLDYLDAKFSTWQRKLCDRVLSVCLYIANKDERTALGEGYSCFYLQMCKQHDARVRDNIKHTLLTILVFTYFSSYMWFSTTAPTAYYSSFGYLVIRYFLLNFLYFVAKWFEFLSVIVEYRILMLLYEVIVIASSIIVIVIALNLKYSLSL